MKELNKLNRNSVFEFLKMVQSYTFPEKGKEIEIKFPNPINGKTEIISFKRSINNHLEHVCIQIWKYSNQ